MEPFCWLFVFIVAAYYFRSGDEIMDGRDWYIVIRYTPVVDWFGEKVDAHFVESSDDAKRLYKGPVKPGQCIRGYWADNENQRSAAAELHEKRRKEDREFELFMRQESVV